MTENQAGRLTTHVLDMRLGQPARGLELALFRLIGDERRLIARDRTNDDGRVDKPLLAGDTLAVGTYELVFDVGAYQAGFLGPGATGFYDQIPIRFQIDNPSAHYHVPLLLSPFGYSTYRGS